MQARIVKDGLGYEHQYREGVPREGEKVEHWHGDGAVRGVVDEVIWISGSERAGDRVMWWTKVQVTLR